MEKKFNINVDCANCAAKMERRIAKIKGVENVTVNFMTQKAIIEADEAVFSEIIKQAIAVCQKIDKETTLVEV